LARSNEEAPYRTQTEQGLVDVSLDERGAVQGAREPLANLAGLPERGRFFRNVVTSEICTHRQAR
jgi:hypothetical protein